MQCKRLQSLIRDWYQEVRSYTLAPLKMMELVEKHIKACKICQEDQDLSLELDQLRELIRVPHSFPSIEEISSELEEPEYTYEKEEIEEIEEEEY